MTVKEFNKLPYGSVVQWLCVCGCSGTWTAIINDDGSVWADDGEWVLRGDFEPDKWVRRRMRLLSGDEADQELARFTAWRLTQ